MFVIEKEGESAVCKKPLNYADQGQGHVEGVHGMVDVGVFDVVEVSFNIEGDCRGPWSDVGHKNLPRRGH